MVRILNNNSPNLEEKDKPDLSTQSLPLDLADSELIEQLSNRLKTQQHKLHQAENFEEKTNYRNSFERFTKDSEFRNIMISGVNALLHAAATMTNYLAKDNPGYKVLNTIVDKTALFCTKIGAPLLSYSGSLIQAFKKKDPILCFIKMIPTIFLPIIGDANIDTVYGASLGFNQPYDLAVERIEARMKQDHGFREQVMEAKKTFKARGALVLSTLKQMCKEFVQGKLPYHEAIYFINCSMLLIGSLPMILFNRNARDTLAAKALGLIRSFGGILGDIGFMTTKTDFKKLMIGGICSVSACASIAKRFVKSDLMAKTLIHLGAALDVAAVSIWNAFNDDSKKAKEVSFA